ncbi:MAG: phytanoyl-CoA dioxygenase family protein [Candidatus Thiodiazotropha sp. (ex Epidulcina cf. delphinae)]|nr:phytanoyl-CoA dioxygenase family protein [Candidatus Thiodiazotropha sp. (ex Epidulcina cf. delphinae)]
MKREYEEYGFYLLENAINGDQVSKLIEKLDTLSVKNNNYGTRDLMNKVPYVREMALSPPLLTIAEKILGEKAKPVRSVFFDKVPGANWNVAWHQDTSIALKEKADVVGFGLWSEKQGVVHVEPPEEYLSSMLTLRVHLDSTNTENGVLRVVPGTHRDGRVRSKDIINIVDSSRALECNANPGDILLMNPLLFHSSRKAVSPSHRRIIHIEYSAMTLPKPLEWFEYSETDMAY